MDMDNNEGLKAGAVEHGAKEPSGAAREIVRRITSNGPMTFAQFMEVALYWPDGGYYTSGRLAWGKGGDYITSIDISPVFSALIAEQVKEMWAALGSPASFELIEAGAGRGWLSMGVLEALNQRCPELGEVIKARLAEKNTALHEPPTGRLTWHDDITGVARTVNAVVLSNELIDSLPVHRTIWDGSLKELYVGLDGTGLVEVPGPPSTPELEQYLDELGVKPVMGQRMDINLAARGWLGAASRLFERGFVITIDYGVPARELYSIDRFSGTLACHYRHTLNTDPFKNIGLQDITAHVDFSALAAWGRGCGLAVTGFTTQKNFFIGLGIIEELKKAEGTGYGDIGKVSYNRAMMELIAPGGMGDTFKVLVQHKGIGKPSLKGFSFKDRSSYL